MLQVRAYRWHTTVVCQLDVLTDAWNLARRRALARLSEEALQVGADAVVGVHLTRRPRSGQADDRVRGHWHGDPASGLERGVVADPDRRLGPGLLASAQRRARTGRLAGHDGRGVRLARRATRLGRGRRVAQNQELEELSRGFHAARDTVRARLLGQVSDAHGAGAVGVEFSHHVHRDKIPVASSLTGTGQRGWRLGRLGIPYRVSGRSDIERKGWVITMHAAGTAIRRGTDAQPSAPGGQNVDDDHGVQSDDRLRTEVARGDPGVGVAAAGAESRGSLHVGPDGQRVHADHRGRVRSGRAGGREFDLPHRDPDRRADQEPRAGHALAGHV